MGDSNNHLLNNRRYLELLAEQIYYHDPGDISFMIEEMNNLKDFLWHMFDILMMDKLRRLYTEMTSCDIFGDHNLP